MGVIPLFFFLGTWSGSIAFVVWVQIRLWICGQPKTRVVHKLHSLYTGNADYAQLGGDFVLLGFFIIAPEQEAVYQRTKQQVRSPIHQ